MGYKEKYQVKGDSMSILKNHMRIVSLDGIPPNSNPFDHDMYNMGTRIASNVMVMHETHPTQKAKYIIIVNTETGERLKVEFPYEEKGVSHGHFTEGVKLL
jgi:hypothetical protein